MKSIQTYCHNDVINDSQGLEILNLFQNGQLKGESVSGIMDKFSHEIFFRYRMLIGYLLTFFYIKSYLTIKIDNSFTGSGNELNRKLNSANIFQRMEKHTHSTPVKLCGSDPTLLVRNKIKTIFSEKIEWSETQWEIVY